MEKDILRATATDMTLVLGAESHIRLNEYPPDPSSKESLRDFVDLILNSENMYFTLPGRDDPGTPVLIQRLGGILSSIPKAAIDLSQETESKILDGFVDLSVHRGRDWLRRWLGFQLLNPIVTEGHRGRVGGTMISEKGYQIWKERRQRIMETVPQNIFPLVPAAKLPEYLEEEIGALGSPDEFLLCYAFDVYRRGWQYLSRVSAADVQATYFPHQLRNSALEASTDAWSTLHLGQQLLWSWGGYIVELLDEPEYEHERSPEKIADRILAIREAKVKIGCPNWLDVAVYEKDGSLRAPTFMKGLAQMIEDTAREADLPLLRKPKDHAVDQLVGAGIEATPDIIELLAHVPLSIVFSGSKLLLAVLKYVSPDAVGRIETERRKVINRCFKGNFIYRGLVPLDEELLRQRR